MALIADVLLAAGALGAGLYCLILSRRLRKLNDLEKGVGGAVAILSAQVDDLSNALKSAQGTAEQSTTGLRDLTERAEGVARRLEVMVASMHDLELDAAPKSPEPKAEEPQAQESSPPPAAEVEPAKEAAAKSEADSDQMLFASRRSNGREAA